MLHIRLSFLTLLTGWTAIWAQAPQAAKAQAPPSFMGPCSTVSCEIQNDWSRNNVLIYLAASVMPEEKYGFKPVPEEQTFGERVLHVAQVNVSILQELGAKATPPVIDPKATSKAVAMAAVQEGRRSGLAVDKGVLLTAAGMTRGLHRSSWGRCRPASGCCTS